MNRRKFLLGSSFTAAAFAEPALFALTVPSAESTARVAGRRIGMADVDILSEHIAHLRKLDFRYGAGRVRHQLVRLLHHEANELLHGTYSDKTGKALLGTVARATCLAGSMAADVGRHALAQRYQIQALNLAMSAGDRLYAANVLFHMSKITLHIGQSAVSEHDRVQSGRQAVALARSGMAVTEGQATPGVAAKLLATEARGYSPVGDASSTRRAVLEAGRQYDRCRPEAEPAWYGAYTEFALGGDLGCSLRDIGEPDQAIRLITQVLDGHEPWRVRFRCFAQTELAIAHLASPDFEHAAALGRDALRTAAQVSSTRTLDRLRTLQQQIRPLRTSSPHLSELDERITDLLTHVARRDENAIT